MPGATTKKIKILLSPLDPVHDVGLRMVKGWLDEAGFETVLLPVDLTNGAIVAAAEEARADVVLLSRSLGYDMVALLSEFIDLAEASGLRERARLGIGGRAVRPALATELGFDGAFGPDTRAEEVIAFVENKSYQKAEIATRPAEKAEPAAGYSYRVHDERVEKLLLQITDQILDWGADKTSPGVERAKARAAMLERSKDKNELMFTAAEGMPELWDWYLENCDEAVSQSYRRRQLPANVREVTAAELLAMDELLTGWQEGDRYGGLNRGDLPMIWTQYGTGCPNMDIAHIKCSESWGSDGVIHFDPSSGARREGLMEGVLAFEGDGSLITIDYLLLMKKAMGPTTQLMVRAHRGLNSPEMVLTAAYAGSHYTKLNIIYGSLHAGTEPERLTVDTLESLRIAAKYGLVYDIPGNCELSGVAAEKAMASLLIMAMLGKRLGAKSMLKPLLCCSPDIMLKGYMKDNYIDYNVGKVKAMQALMDVPICAGEPVGFMTHEADRSQSVVTTALHAALGRELGLKSITIASSDEAYSGGPISIQAKIDTLRGTAEALRFFGAGGIRSTPMAEHYQEQITQGIVQVLTQVAQRGDFIAALREGLLGCRAEGASPGMNGINTVRRKQDGPGSV